MASSSSAFTRMDPLDLERWWTKTDSNLRQQSKYGLQRSEIVEPDALIELYAPVSTIKFAR